MVLNFLTRPIERLIGKVEKTLRMRRLLRETARLNRLYGPAPAAALPPRMDTSQQIERLRVRIRAHCDRGFEIAQTHANATVKLDAAEYAFSSMLDELRGAMANVPSAWEPERRMRSIAHVSQITAAAKAA